MVVGPFLDGKAGLSHAARRISMFLFRSRKKLHVVWVEANEGKLTDEHWVRSAVLAVGSQATYRLTVGEGFVCFFPPPPPCSDTRHHSYHGGNAWSACNLCPASDRLVVRASADAGRTSH